MPHCFFKKTHLPVLFVFVSVSAFGTLCLNAQTKTLRSGNHTFNVFEAHLQERADIPSFWAGMPEDVVAFLSKEVKKGKVEVFGRSAGGRPIHAVLYGKARQGKGTTTFSGALGFRDVRAYRGPDHEMTVYWGMSGVHGFELEGIVVTV